MGYAGKMKIAAVSLLALLAWVAASAPAEASFGVANFTVTARSAGGGIEERAATHPFVLALHLAMNADSAGEPEGVLREIRADLPPGLVGDPLAAPRCRLADFQMDPPQCGAGSQIGRFHGLVTGIGQVNIPIYNLKPLPGNVATLGVSLNGESHLQRLTWTDAGGGAIRFAMALPGSPAIVDVEEEIWGVPADPAHDPERVCLSQEGVVVEGCGSEVEPRPFLTLPASCAGPLRTTLVAISGNEDVAAATALSRDAGGTPRSLAGCDAVPFDPGLRIQTDAGASAPGSLLVGVEISRSEKAERANARLAALHINLPAGLALNPSAGAWLGGCPLTAFETSVGCPAPSWIGSVRLRTPLIDHALSGSIFLAAPFDNPLGSRYAIYLVIEDEATGVVLRIPGQLAARPEDGHLSLSTTGLPPIPFEELELEVAGGARAPLAAPSTCGEYSAQATLMPTTAPFAPEATRTSVFALTHGPGSGPCPPPEVAKNPVPAFELGVVSPAAGTDSSLAIRLSREDTDQRFGSFDLTLPPGLVADLGSVPLGTRVGGVTVKAGVGPEPLALQGNAYLEGPYRGAPYSLAMVVPAQVGPFDLGTITERAAIEVDPRTAQLSVRADPLPQILGGVPLALRDLRLDLDRPGFIHNPTTCGPMAITGTSTSAIGQSVPLSASFRVANCRGLPFAPKLSVRLVGSTRRGSHPRIETVLRPDGGSANLKRVDVSLPGSQLLDPKRIGAVCGLPEAPIEECPAASEVARLEVHTPLLSTPLNGPVFLRPSKGRLPGLVADLDGAIRLRLIGQLGSAQGRLRFAFSDLPDVPFDKLTLRVTGGRRGILVNSGGVCKGSRRLAVTLWSHSGRTRKLSPRLKAHCGRGYSTDGAR